MNFSSKKTTFGPNQLYLILRKNMTEGERNGLKKHNAKKRKQKQIMEKGVIKLRFYYEQGLMPKKIANALNPKRNRCIIERGIKRGHDYKIKGKKIG